MKMKRLVMLQDLYEEQYVAIDSMSNCGSIFKICSYILYSDYLVATCELQPHMYAVGQL